MPVETQYASSHLNDPSRTLFSESKLNRLSNEGENNFAVEYPCILKRISLSTTVATASDFDSMTGDFDSATGNFDDAGSSVTYVNPFTLPDDVISIRRVTWKGYKLDPLPHRNAREVFQNMTQLGRPFWYIFNNVGQNLIQLFPGPNEQLPIITSTSRTFDDTPGDFDSTTGEFDSHTTAGTVQGSGGLDFDSTPGLFDDQPGLFDDGGGAGFNSQTNLYGTNIDKCFIVEYYQAPDFTDAKIPAYIRRRLLKNYIMRGCFNIEGQGQNMKASKYYKERWRMLKEMYGNLLSELHNKPRKLVVNGISASYFFPGVPLLPIDRFGTSVDAGE
jgi:hypothetical protein